MQVTAPPHPPLSPHRGERIKVRGANMILVFVPLFMRRSITEVLYLLNFSWSAQSAALDFVLSGAITLVPSSLESLKMKRLMKKYADLPMDFADATLVCLAHDLAIRHVVTFDQKHFTVYRLPGRQSFAVLP
jgi:hypothetical protein